MLKFYSRSKPLIKKALESAKLNSNQQQDYQLDRSQMQLFQLEEFLREDENGAISNLARRLYGG